MPKYKLELSEEEFAALRDLKGLDPVVRARLESASAEPNDEATNTDESTNKTGKVGAMGTKDAPALK